MTFTILYPQVFTPSSQKAKCPLTAGSQWPRSLLQGACASALKEGRELPSKSGVHRRCAAVVAGNAAIAMAWWVLASYITLRMYMCARAWHSALGTMWRAPVALSDVSSRTVL